MPCQYVPESLLLGASALLLEREGTHRKVISGFTCVTMERT